MMCLIILILLYLRTSRKRIKLSYSINCSSCLCHTDHPISNNIIEFHSVGCPLSQKEMDQAVRITSPLLIINSCIVNLADFHINYILIKRRKTYNTVISPQSDLRYHVNQRIYERICDHIFNINKKHSILVPVINTIMIIISNVLCAIDTTIIQY